MKITQIEIEKIKPYGKNPRRISGAAVDAVKESIENFGMVQPIVVDKKMVIIIGHTRILALKELGYKKVPVLVADKLAPQKVKALRIADNKTGELSLWDSNLLKEELLGLSNEFTGFDQNEINKMFDSVIHDDLSDDDNEQFSIIINCKSEKDQSKLYSEFVDRGLKCRVLSL